MTRASRLAMVLLAIATVAEVAWSDEEAGGGPVRQGCRKLAERRFREARRLFLEALARQGRQGKRPGYLLYHLGQAEEGLGHRQAAWRRYREALTLSWSSPRGDATGRSTARAKLAALAPSGVPMGAVLKSYERYWQHLSTGTRFKDPLVALAARERQLQLDPGNDRLRLGWAEARGAWLKEELAWRLTRPRVLRLRRPLEDWFWRHCRPRVAGASRVVVEAGAGGGAFFGHLNEVEGSFLFAVELRLTERGAPLDWGFVFGDRLGGERRERLRLRRGHLAWSGYGRGAGQTRRQAITLPAGVDPGPGTWHSFVLQHDGLVHRLRLFLGDRVLVDLRAPGLDPVGRLGLFVNEGRLEIRRASLATSGAGR